MYTFDQLKQHNKWVVQVLVNIGIIKSLHWFNILYLTYERIIVYIKITYGFKHLNWFFI